MRNYKYTMGIQVIHGNNTVNIPDPSEWKYQVSDLDSLGKRDATGTLHRNKVATKINYQFKWNSLDWVMLDRIIAAVKHQWFTLVAPDPTDFNDTYTGKYYVGDRSGNCKYYLPEKSDKAQFDLELHFIEY